MEGVVGVVRFRPVTSSRLVTINGQKEIRNRSLFLKCVKETFKQLFIKRV